MMEAEMKKPYWAKLNQFLAAQKGKKVFPPREQIFNALSSCPPEKIKVVILGQETPALGSLACVADPQPQRTLSNP